MLFICFFFYLANNKTITCWLKFYYNKKTLLGIVEKLCKAQGTTIINETTKGNKIVQQNDINWSKRILGNEALAHIKTKIIIQVFNPKVKPYKIPSIMGSDRKLFKLSIVIYSSNGE